MNDLINTPSGGGTPATMSSKEIADLCEKRHDNVMRDAREMIVQLHGEEALLKFEGSYIGQDNSSRPCLNLPKRETLILVSGYRLGLRAKIIDRWQELEDKQATDPMAALNDPATMRHLLLGYSEKVIALEAANATLTPKALALDRISDAEGSLCLTDTAKTLQMRRKDLENELLTRGWIYRRAGRWHGRSEKEKQLLVTHKVTTGPKADGSEWINEQVRVTPKGLVKLASLFSEGRA